MSNRFYQQLHKFESIEYVGNSSLAQFINTIEDILPLPLVGQTSGNAY